jgi:hypothetical protein
MEYGVRDLDIVPVPVLEISSSCCWSLASIGRTGSAVSSPATAHPTTPTPQRRLNFGNLDTFSASKFSITTADEKNLVGGLAVVRARAWRPSAVAE